MLRCGAGPFNALPIPAYDQLISPRRGLAPEHHHHRRGVPAIKPRRALRVRSGAKVPHN